MSEAQHPDERDMTLRTYTELSPSGADNQVADPFPKGSIVVADYSLLLAEFDEDIPNYGRWQARHGTLWTVERSFVQRETVEDDGHLVHEWTRRYVVVPTHLDNPETNDRWNADGERFRDPDVFEGETSFFGE